MTLRRCIACVAALVAVLAPSAAPAIDRTQLAVVVNANDPLSVAIGNYYASRRRIPFGNIVTVRFALGSTTMTRAEFEVVKAQVDAEAGPDVQAYALTWAAPYRVECMSITSAFAFGFDRAYCASGCEPTRPSPYFDSESSLPFAQLGVRPAIAIAATSFALAKSLIDRGVTSDRSRPAGTAYLLSTSDRQRDVRSESYPRVVGVLAGRMRVRELAQEELRGAHDVFLYFIGRARVGGLRTLRFVPGAIADHLTSFGGMLTDSVQMSAMRWLEGGATGSYGTVVEPCNMRQKFPDPAVLARHYLNGETLIEAYWKSVLMPGQGIFVGEPLARPFGRPATARRNAPRVAR
jgi:uncharacterized protein (TIGR03790 family)